jgi:hypothetical protein
MTQKITMKSLLLVTAVFGLAVAARAQSAPTAARTASAPSPAVDTGRGLLGQTYSGLTYTYTDIRHTSINGQGLRFEYNLPLNVGFDAKFTYDGARSEPFAGMRNSSQLLEASAIAFAPQLDWIKPYIEVGGGWLWTKTLGDRDSSFAARLGAGAEFQVTPVLVLTPYATYTHASVLESDHLWNYGVKANYWILEHWGVSAGLDRDNHQNLGYSAGMNYRF